MPFSNAYMTKAFDAVFKNVILHAEPSIETCTNPFLQCTLSQKGIAKGSKVDALIQIPPPKNVSSLRCFLSSVQFYSKFLPNLATVLAPLHQLTKKDTKWKCMGFYRRCSL